MEDKTFLRKGEYPCYFIAITATVSITIIQVEDCIGSRRKFSQN